MWCVCVVFALWYFHVNKIKQMIGKQYCIRLKRQTGFVAKFTKNFRPKSDLLKRLRINDLPLLQNTKLL